MAALGSIARRGIRASSNKRRGFVPLSSRQLSSARAFGIAFDIDGVLLRGSKTIPGAADSLKLLERHNVPFIFLTNGGGCTEAHRAKQLTDKFGMEIDKSRVCLSHSPMRELRGRYCDKRVLVLGNNAPQIASEDLGLNKVVTVEQLVREHEHIYPFATKDFYVPRNFAYQPDLTEHHKEPVEAVMVLHDPLDWAVEVQVVLDVLKGVSLPPGTAEQVGKQTPLYISNADFVFAAQYPENRLAAGAFTDTVKLLYEKLYKAPCQVTEYGKPSLPTFRYAEKALAKWSGGPTAPERLYMVGDNPAGDIRGANEAGDQWSSALLRTGVWKGRDNDEENPADVVFDDVNAFVEWVLRREAITG